jgi:DNA processing protein
MVESSAIFPYLHFLGFTHRDLFAIFGNEPLCRLVVAQLRETPGTAFNAIFHNIPLTDERKAKIHSAHLGEPFDAFEKRLAKIDARVFLHSETDYPQELLDIPNVPFLVYVRGQLDPNALKIGMVGSREATPYGEQIVKSFVPKLARAGISIISGGALGIDSLAHETAIGA